MTVVIAASFLKYVAVFADCRVSYDPRSSIVDDNLQKLYQFGNVIVGFSGSVEGANQIIQKVWRNTETYPKRKHPIASNLQQDIERWIRHEYLNIRHPEHREVKFVLASVEPSREVRPKYKRRLADGTEVENPNPQWSFSRPELSTLVLKPSRDQPEKLVKEEKSLFKIIGPSEENRQAIRRTLEGAYGFAPQYPQLQARATLDWLMVTLMEKGVVEVGGLFQCAVLGAWGIHWLPYNLPSSYGDVSLVMERGRWVQRDNTTGEVLPLLTTWEWLEWQKTHSPGSAGIFEDPGLRKATDNLRKAGDSSINDSEN